MSTSVLICSTEKLSQFCDEVIRDNPESVAIDTEFSRSFSEYYPKLCLLQIAYGDKHCVVDVLEEGIDLSPLQAVLEDTRIFKVFHDCRQDLDALTVVFPNPPKPIFDTQVAAMMCDYYENSVGYSKLVEEFLGVKLNKLSFKRVDWSKRPLTEGKVRYALDDVVYLHKLYGILRDELKRKGRLSWYMQEMDHIGSSETDQYIAMLEGMEFYGDLTWQEATIAISVIEWRERAAILLNVNRNIIMGAKEALCVTRDFIASGGDSCMNKYVKSGYIRDIPFSLTEIVERNVNLQYDLLNFAGQDRNILSVLSILLHSICTKNGVSQKLVASKRELIRSINRMPSNIMHGWRYEFFGKKVEDFVSGKTRLVFTVDGSSGELPQLVVDTQ